MESEDENVAAIKGSAMVYCTECGFANEQGNAFCSQCGSPLEQPEANPAAPASPEPPAGRPGVDHTKAVVIVLIALICVVALVIGLFITHSMGLWGAQPQAQTSAQSTGADALDSADDGTTDSSAVSAMVIDGTSADSSEDATIATTSQSGKQFVAADFYLPVYLAAQDNGDDNAKAQANAMMGSMDTAMPAIWWRLRISNCT